MKVKRLAAQELNMFGDEEMLCRFLYWSFEVPPIVSYEAARPLL